MRTYEALIQSMLGSGHELMPFSGYFRSPSGRFIILRQDVDLNNGNSLKVARLQHMIGIRSTFYFRMVPQYAVGNFLK